MHGSGVGPSYFFIFREMKNRPHFFRCASPGAFVGHHQSRGDAVRRKEDISFFIVFEVGVKRQRKAIVGVGKGLYALDAKAGIV